MAPRPGAVAGATIVSSTYIRLLRLALASIARDAFDACARFAAESGRDRLFQPGARRFLFQIGPNNQAKIEDIKQDHQIAQIARKRPRWK